MLGVVAVEFVDDERPDDDVDDEDIESLPGDQLISCWMAGIISATFAVFFMYMCPTPLSVWSSALKYLRKISIGGGIPGDRLTFGH